MESREQETRGLRWTRRVAAASGGMLVSAVVLWALLAITQVLVERYPPSGSAWLVVWWVSYGVLVVSACVGGFVAGRFAYDAPAVAGLITGLVFFLFCVGFVGNRPGAPPSLSTPGGGALTALAMALAAVLFSTFGAITKVNKLTKERKGEGRSEKVPEGE